MRLDDDQDYRKRAMQGDKATESLFLLTLLIIRMGYVFAIAYLIRAMIYGFHRA